MAVHAQPKYGGSPPWHSLSQAYVGEGFMGLAVGIEVIGAFVGFDIGVDVGVGVGLNDNGDGEGAFLNDMYVHHASFPSSPSAKY